MNATNITALIIGVSLATLLPRILPVLLFSRFKFPPRLQLWLSYVPPAVLGGLTLLSVLAPTGTSWAITPANSFIWAFVPTLLIAIKTRHLFLTMASGIAAAALIHWLSF
jgi:branched-subunit amino acid transport protein